LQGLLRSSCPFGLELSLTLLDNFFACLNAIPNMLPYQSLKFRGLEADDIITFLTQNISPNFEHTWIVTSDRDMFQLLSDKISIFNIFSKKEIDIGYFLETYSLKPEEYLFSRILEGDKSDNILGVEGIGPKRAQQLAKEYTTLDKLLKALPLKGKAKYISNLNDVAKQFGLNSNSKLEDYRNKWWQKKIDSENKKLNLKLSNK
jgi:5'-3' exonuclease